MNIKEISNNIFKLRKEKKWSQERLAREADIPFTTLTKIENGTTKNPSIETLIKIANALGVTVDILISESKNAKSNK
jgi:transcriptional regulator with XRE-family HTH domain